MDLAKELRLAKEHAKREVPKPFQDRLEEAQRNLAASNILDHALNVGDEAPDFALPDHTYKIWRLKDILHNGPAIVSFYRGSWCPYCKLELQALHNSLPEIRQRGASVIGISPQKPEHLSATRKAIGIAFPLLSDAASRVARQYGLVYTLDPKIREIYRDMGINLEETNAEDPFELPLAATYVIDTRRVIRHAHVEVDHTRRESPPKLLAALSKLTGHYHRESEILDRRKQPAD